MLGVLIGALVLGTALPHGLRALAGSGAVGNVPRQAVVLAVSGLAAMGADFDLALQLHQVDHGLAQAVAAADEGARRRGVHAFGAVDGAVAVLVKNHARRRAR